MCRVRKTDKIRNDDVRRAIKVGSVAEVDKEKRLKWYGLVRMRREEAHAKKNG